MEKHTDSVIPAKAGIPPKKQVLINYAFSYMKIRDYSNILKFLDSHFRGNDILGDFRILSDNLLRGNDSQIK